MYSAVARASGNARDIATHGDHEGADQHRGDADRVGLGRPPGLGEEREPVVPERGDGLQRQEQPDAAHDHEHDGARGTRAEDEEPVGAGRARGQGAWDSSADLWVVHPYLGAHRRSHAPLSSTIGALSSRSAHTETWTDDRLAPGG